MCTNTGSACCRQCRLFVGIFLQNHDSGKPHVLVVEDSILVAMAIEDVLVSRDLDVSVATTLSVAEALIELRTPDAALLDLQLPDGYTLDLARKLYERGCAVAFSSAYDAEAVPSSHAFARQFRKPASPDLLGDWVVASLQIS